MSDDLLHYAKASTERDSALHALAEGYAEIKRTAEHSQLTGYELAMLKVTMFAAEAVTRAVLATAEIRRPK